MVSCPNCGTENEENSQFCQNCGQAISNKLVTESSPQEKPSTLLIVLGYALSILGIFSVGILSVVGLILGIVLYRRAGPNKTHGIIIMILSVAILLIVVIGVMSLIVYRAYFYTP